jgi:hypothetical protein
MREAFDAFADVVDEPMTVEEVLDVTKADVGILTCPEPCEDGGRAQDEKG